VFGLDESSLGTEHENFKPNHDDKISDTVAASKIESNDAQLQSFSLEEERRQARDNWLRLRRQEIDHEPDASRRVKEDLGQSPDNDIDD
jgi:hypothetical protein